MATSPAVTFTPEFARMHAETVLQSLEFETPATRCVIQAITDPDFRIDPKARTARELAWHIVNVEVAFLNQIADGKFDMSDDSPAPKTVDEIVKWYDENLPKALFRVRNMTAQQLLTPMDFFGMFNFPAFLYIEFAVKHSVHHRGQLAAFLRPMGSKCPSIYGGSADVPFEPPTA